MKTKHDTQLVTEGVNTMKSKNVKTVYIGTNKGGLIKVEIPADAKKSDRESPAAFYRRVGTQTVLREG